MSKIFDTLYKRSSKGALQQWTVSVEDENGSSKILKFAGQVGGKLIPHVENITVGLNLGKTNETTPAEQALSQAESDWKRKHDSGYKSLVDLCITQAPGEHDDLWIITGNPIGRMLTTALEEVLPQFNTDAAGELLPQLAPSKLWEKGSKKNKYPMQAETKFDGNRTTIVLTPTDTYALTRTGKPQLNLPHFLEILDKVFPRHLRTNKIILDGEVYLHGLLLEDINEAIKKTNENTPKLQFFVYDLPLHGGKQKDRTAAVEIIVNMIDNYHFQRSVPVIVYSDEEVEAFHDLRVSEGNEGAMVKDLEGTYEPGVRSHFWSKVKVFEDNEYEIIGHRLGSRGAQDLNFVCMSAGGTFEATMNGTIAIKERLALEAPSLVGRKLTVQHKGYTKYNIPYLPKGKAIYVAA